MKPARPSRITRAVVVLVAAVLCAAATVGANALTLFQKPPPPPPPPDAGPTTSGQIDTGLTRVRVNFVNNAAWAYVTLDGTQIKASRVISTSGQSKVTGLGPQIAVTGAGTAVIDFVLAIPQGAATGMSMCKHSSNSGPATVTVTRTTQANAAQVVQIVDNTDDPYVAPDGCQNYMHTDVARSAFMGPTRWPVRADPRPFVLANYYPWYDSQTIQTNFGDNPVNPTTSANTDDPAQVAQMVTAAANAGVDGFVVEYDDNAWDNARTDSVLNAVDAHPGFYSAMTLDLDVVWERHNHMLSNSTLDNALRNMASKMYRASQIRVHGNPVMFLYGSDKTSPYQWKTALKWLQNQTGIVPFVIADANNMNSGGQFSYSTHVQPDDVALNRWAQDELNQLHIQPGIAGVPSPVWVAPVSPGYDDTRLGRPQPVYVDRAGGQRYDNEWTASLASLPDWIMITSWNEYYEQTHIAPGTTTGTRALTQTSSWASQFHITG